MLEYLASAPKLDVREFAVRSPMLYLFTHGASCVFPHTYPSGFPYFSLASPDGFHFHVGAPGMKLEPFTTCNCKYFLVYLTIIYLPSLLVKLRELTN